MLSNGKCPICDIILVESDRCPVHNLRFYDKVTHMFGESHRGYSKYIDGRIDDLNVHHFNRLRYKNNMNKANILELDAYIKLVILEDNMFDHIINEVQYLTTK